jgi:hypothetical protein
VSNSRGAKVGDCVQITSLPGDRSGWVGAFVLVTEVKGWGIQGFVPILETHTEQRQAYTRLTWEQFEVIGPAILIPGEEPPDGT